MEIKRDMISCEEIVHSRKNIESCSQRGQEYAIILEPELYAPNMDEHGLYVDHVPSNYKHGIRCPCTQHKDRIYSNYTSFLSHIKTKMHKKWLENINLNRSNFFVESMKLEKIIKNQQQIIARLEIEIKNKGLTIDYLSGLLMKQQTQTPIEDLLDIND